MEEKDIDQYFDNHFDCYTLYYNGANVKEEAPAMTKFAFRDAIVEIIKQIEGNE